MSEFKDDDFKFPDEIDEKDDKSVEKIGRAHV